VRTHYLIKAEALLHLTWWHYFTALDSTIERSQPSKAH